MKACTFFGHRETAEDCREALAGAIRDRIEEGYSDFYVGNHGGFDRLALSCLRNMQAEGAGIRVTVVLAYLPEPGTQPTLPADVPTLYPEGIECVPKRFAIHYRNRYLLSVCDTVIAFVTHPGGAAKAVEEADRKKKRVIRLAKY